jgi:hypothetical protein
MKRIALVLLTIGTSVVLCSYASAQQKSSPIPTEATNKLAKDLANLQTQILAAQQQATSQEAAQTGASRRKIEVTRNADVLAGADPSAQEEFKASKGTDFWVLDKQNGYYAVVGDDGKTGWIPASDVKPKYSKDMTGYGDWELKWYKYDMKTVATTEPSIQEKLFQTITDRAVKFRDSYKDNPYFQVSGFTINVGVTPSVEIAFTFK